MKKKVYEMPAVKVINLASHAQLLAGSMLSDYDVQPEQDLAREFRLYIITDESEL